MGNNSATCQRNPVKKNGAEFDFEIQKQAEVARFLEIVRTEKQVDLEAWETGLRRAVLVAGAQVLQEIVAGLGCGRSREPVICRCGQRMSSVGLRHKTVQTILGPIEFTRSLLVCWQCGAGRFPGDELLGVEETSYSPGLRRMMARSGSRSSFGQAAEDLRVYAEVHVGAKDVERTAEEVGQSAEAWMHEQRQEAIQQRARPGQQEEQIPILYVSFDGTGIPMRREELLGRQGKNGPAKTREVKLGCVFTQTTTDEEGRPVRDPASTTYVGAIEGSEDFGWRIYGEAVRRGVRRAQHVVLLTDGAAYNKTIASTHFPDACHIIDLYHAREHLHNFVKLVVPDTQRTKREEKWLQFLNDGNIGRLTTDMRTYLPRSGKRRKDAVLQIQYFADNAQHMRYQAFRAQGLFVGSGVVEAGCRTIIGARLKQSGMFWSVRGANAIIAARCCLYSGLFEDFWAHNVG